MDEKKRALAKYLEINEEEITVTNNNEYELEDGRSYKVLTDEEADEEVHDSIENFIDDLGIEGFTESFQETIKNNYIDREWFEDVLQEDIEYLVSELSDEEVLEEAEDNDLISNDDKDEEGEYDLTKIDLDDLRSRLVEIMVDREDDPVEYYIDNFGKDTFNVTVKDNKLFDLDGIVEDCISLDGRGHNLAFYDGVELELEDDFYAYRIN